MENNYKGYSRLIVQFHFSTYHIEYNSNRFGILANFNFLKEYLPKTMGIISKEIKTKELILCLEQSVLKTKN